MKIHTLAILLACVHASFVTAVPLKRQDNSTTYNPEAKAIEVNGPLPKGTETIYTQAKNITTYPSSVAKAMSASNDVRIASEAEIQTLTYYTTLSANAYCRTVIPLGQWACPHCDAVSDLKITKTFTTLVTDTNVLVAVGSKEKTIYVVFRGTSSIRNAITDIVFAPVDYPPVNGAKVHKGFLDSYNEVQKDLVKEVEAQVAQYPDYKLTVTGHSLGGATAVLCALDLKDRGHDVSLYTQGQPRVGTPAFANYVLDTKIPYQRLVHKRDIVPHLPPGAFGFLHAGEEFWIVDDDPTTVRVCPNGIETDDCANSIVPFTSALDHLSYLDINTGLCL
ncbi:lipase [Lichtheimia hyalospora FSU 10163]|nr:lipase [Lichtheimia hyalospora FSU 10163]